MMRDFFGEQHHVGHFAEIAYLVGVYPLVNSLLCFFEGHVVLFSFRISAAKIAIFLSAKVAFPDGISKEELF